MSSSKAERILTGLLFVNSDAIIKVFPVHISSGDLNFFLLGNYCYVVNCIVFGVNKEVMDSYHCIQFTNSYHWQLRETGCIHRTRHLQRNLSLVKMCNYQFTHCCSGCSVLGLSSGITNNFTFPSFYAEVWEMLLQHIDVLTEPQVVSIQAFPCWLLQMQVLAGGCWTWTLQH